MHIGVDFDNTLVCYDGLFHKVALERGLIPAELAVSKWAVREHIRRNGGEEKWTELQGVVYGERMAEAVAYPGALQFFVDCRRTGIRLSIISHKTRQPVLGRPQDLHQAALSWLEQNRFFDPAFIGLSRGDVFFELTRAAKLARIVERGCSHFIDDLPEVLTEPAFPKIQRILFDPNSLHAAETDFQRAQTWAGIWQILRGPTAPLDLSPAITEFLSEHGYSGVGPLVALSGGGNNRVYRVSLPDGDAVLKQYFQSAPNTHDRFQSERAIYDFLWPRGVRWTPEPLAWDQTRRLGLMRFVPGSKLRVEDLSQQYIEQVLAFLIDLNRERSSARVPIASTPCFQTKDLLVHVAGRLEGFKTIEVASELDRQAQTFIADKLVPAWAKISAALEKAMPMPEPLPQELRVISPSDFGFHNSILAEDGRLRFFDFEYAGWDDPAQMIGDFFCQPQVRVPKEFCEQFSETLARELKLGSELPGRVRAYLPALRIKWCCIILNEFRRGVKARRDFARGTVTTDEMKSTQLEKARRYFEKTFPQS